MTLRYSSEVTYDNHVDSQHAQLRVIEVKRILQRQVAVLVRKHDAGVLDDVDVFRGPPRRDIADHALQQLRPVASEADKQRCLFRIVLSRRTVGLGRSEQTLLGRWIPGEQRKRVRDGTRRFRGWFVELLLWFGVLVAPTKKVGLEHFDWSLILASLTCLPDVGIEGGIAVVRPGDGGIED